MKTINMILGTFGLALALGAVSCGGAMVTWDCACAATCDGVSGAVVTTQICASQDEAQMAVDDGVASCVSSAGCAGATCACSCQATSTDC